ncbi:zinc-dependent alcohol dehydrogenase family protein [Chenggangzhangella methanolivorans]|uniref:NAD(P)-dependent alcohol dehydrogenase n=1 Tax=Chenggangzhangella methanolivorans TaxID=1437009 RepID=A0A9E6UHV8_9HYPH|nr:NAD(P)-dependent alcohol dehydrogenase [Chenggangzhangella methanolivorans]QZO00138.1 NAD(P)-dependent alcohol dehydrogenase [Chenggangzhangella methanolivorans]
MKAMTLGSPAGLDTLALVDKDEPGGPGPGEIRVRLKASSLNFHDYAVATGMLPSQAGRVLMSDGAGVVEEVGAGVDEFAAGDHVVSTFFPTWIDGRTDISDFSLTPGDGVDGYACEMVTAPATSFTRAPKGWTHAEAATLTCAGLTAWRALVVNGGLKAGDVVLTMGTGGVSIFALQIAKAMGATVIATSSSDEKMERLKSLGADHVINYRSTENWGEAAHGLAYGRGVDHVVEIGGPGTLAQSFAAARVGGHVSLIGIFTGLSGEVPTFALMAKQARLQGMIVGSRRHQQDMVEAMEATGLKPVIDRSFGLDALGEAFRHQESNRHFGKICLEF